MPAPFHVDSETEDDYEAGLLSPYLTGGDGEGNLGVDGNLIDASSAEPTPTKQSHEGLHYPSPGSRISGWSKDQVAVYIRDLGLKQYCESFLGKDLHFAITVSCTGVILYSAFPNENYKAKCYSLDKPCS